MNSRQFEERARFVNADDERLAVGWLCLERDAATGGEGRDGIVQFVGEQARVSATFAGSNLDSSARRLGHDRSVPELVRI